MITARRKNGGSARPNRSFWSFRLATYFILACATYIFLDIGIKGGRTVFRSSPPFINVPFLT
jgi:phosphate transport system permease protein